MMFTRIPFLQDFRCLGLRQYEYLWPIYGLTYHVACVHENMGVKTHSPAFVPVGVLHSQCAGATSAEQAPLIPEAIIYQ